jgi:hypothetical protein
VVGGNEVIVRNGKVGRVAAERVVSYKSTWAESARFLDVRICYSIFQFLNSAEDISNLIVEILGYDSGSGYSGFHK